MKHLKHFLIAVWTTTDINNCFSNKLIENFDKILYTKNCMYTNQNKHNIFTEYFSLISYPNGHIRKQREMSGKVE